MNNPKIFTFIFLILIVSMAGDCGGGNPQPTNTQLLSKTWRISNVLSNNISKSISNFRLTFTESSYTMNNPDGVPQPNNAESTSGNWHYPTNCVS